jgi:hypothetical protein
MQKLPPQEQLLFYLGYLSAKRFSMMASATRMPSIAAEIIPPA